MPPSKVGLSMFLPKHDIPNLGDYRQMKILIHNNSEISFLELRMFPKSTKNLILEWFGVLTAILYSMLIALNIGAEFIGFLLLLISAISIAIWSYRNNFKGMLLLQLFYASAGLIGMVRWLSLIHI